VKFSRRLFPPPLVALLLGVLAVAVAAAQSPPDRTVNSGAPNVHLLLPAPDYLDSLFARLRELETHTGNPRVCLMQFGDSHTASDLWTGELRRLLQTRFGDAGRGYVLPGRFHKWYYPMHLKVGTEGKWELTNSLSKTYAPPVGISGFRVKSNDRRAKMWFATGAGQELGARFSKLRLDYLARPRAGAMLLRIDNGRPVTVKTRGPQTALQSYAVNLADAPHRVEIQPAGDGAIELLGAVLEREAPGVIVENLGVGGSEYDLLPRLDPVMLQQGIRDRDPALVILAWGTCEAFYYEKIPYDYRQMVDQAVGLVQAAAPGVPIVMVGPGDANRLNKPCREWMLDGDIDVGRLACAPNALFEVPTERFTPDYAACRFSPPHFLEPIREIQREVAFTRGVAYWEWGDLMGGDCGMHRWMLLPEPMGQRDHIHLTKRGYTYTGQDFYRALMEHYENYKRRR